VSLRFWCTQCSLKHPAGESLVLLSQEIGVDTPHFSPLCPSSHSAKCDEHYFTDTSLTRAFPYRLLGDCVKTSNTVSTVPLSVKLRGLQSVPCPYFGLFNEPSTCRATVQLPHILVVVFHIHFSNVFAPLSPSPFPVAFKIHLHCSNVNQVLSFCFMMASVI
jgi:hypothetical protein